MKDAIGVIALGLLFGAMFAYGCDAKAETLQMTNAQGYQVGTVQINGNTAQFVNPQGITTQTATIYPNQVVIQNPNLSNNAIVVGRPIYTVPPSPPTIPSVRVMQ